MSRIEARAMGSEDPRDTIEGHRHSIEEPSMVDEHRRKTFEERRNPFEARRNTIVDR